MQQIVYSSNFVQFINRSILVLLVGLSVHFSAFAQGPSFSFPSDVIYNAGDEICMGVSRKDFTDLVKVRFSMHWDPNVLQFQEVRQFNMGSLNASHFNDSLSHEGYLVLDWDDDTGRGLTLPDNVSIFMLCFKVIGSCGSYSPLEFTQYPVRQYIGRRGVSSDIDFYKFNGNASICAYPVEFHVAEERVNPQEEVCVSVDVEEFSNVESAQFSMDWDTSVIKFRRLALNPDFPFLSTSNFNLAQAPNGRLTFSWAAFTSDNGITIPDGTNFFDVCFTAVGRPGSSSPVRITSVPSRLEVTTNFDGITNPAGVTVDNGRVTVNQEPGAVTIQAAQMEVNVGAPVCVPVKVIDFRSVDGLAFSMSWNPELLRFDSVKVEEGVIPSFDATNFNLANTASGIFTMDWALVTGAAALMNNATLFEVCYTAIGPGGSTSPVAFPTSPVAPFVDTVGASTNAGLNTRNGLVTILQPRSLNLASTSATAQPGESFCVDITADNFENIVSLDYTMSWETGLVEFQSVTGFGLPGLTASNFNTTNAPSGLLTLSWQNPSGQTLPDATVLYSICFQAKATAPQGECAEIFFSEVPNPPAATTTTSNGTFIEVTRQNGEICIYDPEGFSVHLPAVSVDPDSSLCIPVRMTKFNNLEKIQFSINWNPSIVEFAGVNSTGTLPNLNESSFDLSLTNIGVLSLTWTSPTSITLQDSTVVFELCFNAVGDRLSCTALNITGNPKPFEVIETGSTDNISLNPLHGQVCINDALYIDDIFITEPTCGNSTNGSIEVVVSGGQEPYSFIWDADPGQSTEIVTGLSAGTYNVTVRDLSGLTTRATIEVQAAASTPIASAGLDFSLTCDQTVGTLDGTASSVGDNITYRWRIVEGDGFILSGGSTQTPLINGSGIYELKVSNLATGCEALDSVTVNERTLPVASAGPDTVFTCNTTTIVLDGTASDRGENITYTWRAIVGGNIVSGDTTLTPTIDAPGIYQLEVNHSAGCQALDTVVVANLRDILRAEAGPGGTIGCDGATLIVGVDSLTSRGDSISYLWTSPSGGTIVSGVNSLFAEVGSAGIYVLNVMNERTGCFARDTVTIDPDETAALITVLTTPDLSCRDTVVSLNIVVSSVDNFSVAWTTDNGSIVPGQDTVINALVDAPGTYRVTITNLVNGCQTVSGDVVVQTNYDIPVAEAGPSVGIDCSPTATATLNALNGSSEGTNFQYTWSTNNPDAVIISGTSAQPIVDRPGVYYLRVTNRTSGCSAIDSVTVELNTDFTLSIVEPGPIPCGGGVVELKGTASDPNTTYLWTVLEGSGIIQNPDTNTIIVNMAGVYLLEAISASGCIATDTVTVTGGQSSDVTVTASTSNTFITCLESEATLSATVTPANGSYTYEWINLSAAGVQPPNPNALQTTVQRAGNYTIIVTNTATGCVSRDTILVQDNLDVPEEVVIDKSGSLALDCSSNGLTLDGSATFMEPTFTAEWTTTTGHISGNPTELITRVDSAGVYYLKITDSVNGCFAIDSVEVSSASDIEVSIETPDMLNCTTPRLALRATLMIPGNNISYAWSTNDGVIERDANTAFPVISSAGTYTVTVTNTVTNCTDVASVRVEEDKETPNADAGADVDLGCESEITIGGSGTSTGAEFTYKWTTIGNGSIESGTNTPFAVAGSAGTYQLEVTNTRNNCKDTAIVVVHQEVELIDAQVDRPLIQICDSEANVAGNLPSNVTGVWTTLSTATIITPTTKETVVNNLESGENIFIWTLSTDQCPNYSSDTARIVVQAAPTANNDVANFNAKDEVITINVTANDILYGATAIVTRGVTEPKVGQIVDFSNGVLQYTAKPLVNGEDEFMYEVCNASCPDRCDTATLRIILESDPDAVQEQFQDLPNAITPNDDGFNDRLVFDFLVEGTQAFPDNQIIIFNRWGDIVWEAKPYQNDWDGKGKSGKELPQGTYYYILRLNIADGLILKGDVTILK